MADQIHVEYHAPDAVNPEAYYLWWCECGGMSWPAEFTDYEDAWVHAQENHIHGEQPLPLDDR